MNIKLLSPQIINTDTYSALLNIQNGMLKKLGAKYDLPLAPVYEDLKHAQTDFIDNCHYQYETKTLVADVFFNTLHVILNKNIKIKSGS
jgi:hypothetical protein